MLVYMLELMWLSLTSILRQLIFLQKLLQRQLKSIQKTKPIIPVHFVELPCEMDQMKLMADQAGIASIENVAHAHGAVYPNIGHIGSCT